MFVRFFKRHLIRIFFSRYCNVFVDMLFTKTPADVLIDGSGSHLSKGDFLCIFNIRC